MEVRLEVGGGGLVKRNGCTQASGVWGFKELSK